MTVGDGGRWGDGDGDGDGDGRGGDAIRINIFTVSFIQRSFIFFIIIIINEFFGRYNFFNF